MELALKEIVVKEIDSKLFVVADFKAIKRELNHRGKELIEVDLGAGEKFVALISDNTISPGLFSTASALSALSDGILSSLKR